MKDSALMRPEAPPVPVMEALAGGRNERDVLNSAVLMVG